MHFLRLYGSGLFDAHPRVKIVLDHNSEALPFLRDRVDKFFNRKWGRRKRDWMTVWNENVCITTSAMFHLGPLRCYLEICKPDRILYSMLMLSRLYVLQADLWRRPRLPLRKSQGRRSPRWCRKSFGASMSNSHHYQRKSNYSARAAPLSP